MGKIKRGGYFFITWAGAHPPRHVHVYVDDKLVLKWNLDSNVSILGKPSRKIFRILQTLIKGKIL